MATELRKTGVDVVGDMPWGTHFCLFYETTSNLLSRAANHSKLGGQRLRPRSPFWLSEYETAPPEFGSGALPTADLTVPGRVTARHNQADRIYNSAGALFVKAPSAGFASNDIGAGFDADRKSTR